MAYCYLDDYIHSEYNEQLKFFKFSDIVYSSTALSLDINNSLPAVYLDNALTQLRSLDKLRDGFPHAIIITSGYRCDILNRMVGGAKHSKHLTASAVDIQLSPKRINTLEKRNLLVYYLVHSDIKFNKVIFEPTWLHIEFGEDNHRQIIR